MNEDQEFDSLILEKRHKEIIKALQSLSESFKKDDVSSLSIVEKSFKQLMNFISSTQTPIETYKEVVEEYTNKINLAIEKLMEKKEFQFQIIRDASTDSIKEVIVKQIK